MIAVDTNILVHAHRKDSPHNDAAWQCLAHADLKGRFADAMGARDEVIEGAVAETNEANAEILVVPKMSASRN